MRKAWLAGDVAAASRITHTVKGLCGTVGALALAGQAAALAAALTERSPEADIAGLVDQFEAALEPMCAALQAALPPA